MRRGCGTRFSGLLMVLVMMAARGGAETRVLFTAMAPDGYYQLHSIGTNGTGLIQLTTNTISKWAPALSPDGMTVAYVSTNALAPNIRLTPFDGGGDAVVSNTYPALAVQWYKTNVLMYIRAAGDSYPYPYELWRIDTNGGHESQVFTNRFSCWPMGRQTFCVDRARDKVYLTSFPPEGGRSRIFSGNPGMEASLAALPVQSPLMLNSDHYAPSVSPDGSNVVYCADFGAGNHCAYRGAADGSGDATLLSDPYCGSTTWGPSGTHVAFVRDPLQSTYGGHAYVGDIVYTDPLAPNGSNYITAASAVAGRCAFPTIYETPDAPPPALPVVRHVVSSNVLTATSAELHGELVSTGGAPTTVSLYWGADDGGTNAGLWRAAIELGARGTGGFHDEVPITTNKQYWYRASASNSAGVVWAPSSTPFGYAAPAFLPFNETFDTNATEGAASIRGSLAYQNGWECSPSDAAAVQDAAAHGGPQSACLRGGGMTRRFAGGTTNVWFEAYARVTPTSVPTNVPLDATVVFWFDADGHVAAYDGAVQKSMADTRFPLDGWLRVAVNADYTRKRWSLWVGGTNVLSNFAFYSGVRDAFESISVAQIGTNVAAYVDDIMVGTNSPGGFLDDSDGDDMNDLWERLNFSGDLRVAGRLTDFDGDGFLDLNEYRAGTFPGRADSLLQITGLVWLGAGRYVMNFDTVGGRGYLVESSTNLVSGAWQSVTPSPLPGVDGSLSCTVTVERTVEELHLRVKTGVPE